MPAKAKTSKKSKKTKKSKSASKQSSTKQAASPTAPTASAKAQKSPPRPDKSEAFVSQVHYDFSSGKYVGTVLEVPSIRIEAKTKPEALDTLKEAILDHLASFDEGHAPQPLSKKTYPETLDTPISQSLYRKLDYISKRERIDLDKLITELLSAGLERRETHSGAGAQQRTQPTPPNGNNRFRTPAQRPNRNHGNHNASQGNHRRPQGGNKRYHQTMDSRENFMEYVRRLEKGGGGKWRK